MKLTGLLTRHTETLPGITGVARVDRRTRELLRRVGPGDIVVLDQIDLDRATAGALVEAGVAAVLNASPSISGRFPNLGPEIVVGAGIPLVDGVGAEVFHRLKDGAKVRLHEGVLYAGERRIASGAEQTPESVADQMIEAKAGMSTQLEAFSANTIEFLRRERTLILDGVGVPEVRVPLRDRHVLVVAPGKGHAAELKTLKKYIAEHRPVLIGVDAGADTLRELGYQPDIIVGDPSGIDAETLKAGAEVVVPAQPDGHAPGLARIQDLGIGAVTFPASGNPEDLALLIADRHEAGLVVTVGFQATLREFLDHGRSGSNPSTFLTRLKLGTKLVDGKAVAALHRSRVSLPAVLLLVLAALAVVAVALLTSNVGDVYLHTLAGYWNSFIGWLKGFFA
ncbi:putative cytokinetic ring protein SteA [Amycolatopsis cynarae]|uniref:Cytokinetic ring protein SteA n=1 Tax=Amycolatopsis cynarae TaxID=2995223 RepID=A0ABY7B6U3_9PSEU|nr:putative cytokinetic ring protein SteA [Amycolatopsis sp. HUAS 11-8]WAL68035.1 putative cytokinetic ring protein SteA [Amycolatopsis sp. HUAS 11-8]